MKFSINKATISKAVIRNTDFCVTVANYSCQNELQSPLDNSIIKY